MKQFAPEIIEARIAQRFLERANPPPILYRYRRPTDWTLDEISKRELYAAAPDALNDPFECIGPVFWNIDLIKREFTEKFAPAHGLSVTEAINEFESSLSWGMERLQEMWKITREETAIACFSAQPNSIRMWSYYAQAHEGICIGYDTTLRPFNVALKVKYQDPDKPFDVVAAMEKDPTEIAFHTSFRKSAEWEFEDEYRIATNGVGFSFDTFSSVVNQRNKVWSAYEKRVQRESDESNFWSPSFTKAHSDGLRLRPVCAYRNSHLNLRFIFGLSLETIHFCLILIRQRLEYPD